MILKTVDFLGQKAIRLVSFLGSFFIFIGNFFKTFLSSRLKMKQVILHMQTIGVGSISIIFLTGISSGLALALQTYIGLSRLGTESFIGLVVALGMTRELGPVLTGLMVAGRCGSAMAAEIGTMQITEQVDALKTLRINPFQYLIVPRIIAATLILPFLTVCSMLCGIAGGYIYCVYILNMSPESYISPIEKHVQISDIIGGLVKSSCFGFFMSWVGSYMGYYTFGGAQGVGIATTKSVVMGSILILISNYLLSSLLFQVGI